MADILTLTKINLGITGTTYDEFLSHLIEAAKESVKREGITLTDSAEDANIVTMYAAYLFRKRGSENQEMPRMLRYALNNRLFAEKMEGDDVK